MDRSQQVKGGNAGLFFFMRVFNLIFGLSALGLIAVSIWLWTKFHTFTIIEIIFVGLGVFEFVLVLVAFSARKSKFRLRCYLIFMFVLFVAQLTSVIVVFVTGQDIIKRIAQDSQQQIAQLRNNLDVVKYYCVGSLVLIALQLILTYCYVGSFRQRNQQFDYKVLDQQGNKISLQQKNNRDKQNIQQKYSKKRQQFNKKYGR